MLVLELIQNCDGSSAKHFILQEHTTRDFDSRWRPNLSQIFLEHYDFPQIRGPFIRRRDWVSCQL